MKLISESFNKLTPDMVLTSLEEVGFHPTGRTLQLNSYENRVFEIELEEDEKVVAKFYRPGRWSLDTILDEHDFLLELKEEGIHAVSPLILPNDSTVAEHHDLYLTVFPKFYGRMPQEFLGGDLQKVGRTLARIHNVGARKRAEHRFDLTTEDYAEPALEILDGKVSPEVSKRYFEAAETILDHLDQKLDPDTYIRIHGDCHKGNLLNNGEEFFFVDFDDFNNGPPAQDFWMLFSGDSEESKAERDQILEGYEELRTFPGNSFSLFEPLRGLRVIHYAAWIARRWVDPSFPALFPEFGTYPYWAEETEALEKIAWRL